MIVAVGAHSRKVGKTSIVCALLRATPEAAWTAVKISANRRGLGEGLEIDQEKTAGLDCDTGRFLNAGARRSVWIRAADSRMGGAADAVARIAAHGGHTIVESNRLVDWLPPDLYVLALDPSIPDFKESARRLFSRADAYVISGPRRSHPDWPALPLEALARKPAYTIEPPNFAPERLIGDLRRRLGLESRVAAA